jgi:hypothetical protein
VKIDKLIQVTPSGNTQIHSDGLQEQYNESRKHAQLAGSPVFNVFHLVNLPDGEDGTKNFQVCSQYYDTKKGLPMAADMARELLKQFHDTPNLDATIIDHINQD